MPAKHNGQRENISFSIDMNLIPLLREYCRRNDRNQSDAVNVAIKTLIAVEKAKDPAFWEGLYNESEV